MYHPRDGSVMYGLVWVKLTAQVEEEGLALLASSFSRLVPLSTYPAVHRYALLASLI
jgi:hypothetical protein